MNMLLPDTPNCLGASLVIETKHLLSRRILNRRRTNLDRNSIVDQKARLSENSLDGLGRSQMHYVCVYISIHVYMYMCIYIYVRVALLMVFLQCKLNPQNVP